MAEAEGKIARIGGTDISKIVGVDSFGGPIDAWRRIVEGFSPEMNKAMERGRRMEPVVRAMYVDDTRATLEAKLPYLVSTKYEFMGASLDDLATRDGEKLVVEYKTAGIRAINKWGESGSDQVPDNYRVQVAWYLLATGRTFADLACLICGDDLRIYRLTRDLELESMLLEAAERFWKDHVLTKTPPPPDAHESYERWLEQRYPDSRGEFIAATPELEYYAKRLEEATHALDVAEAQKQWARNHLIQRIGDAAGLQGEGWRISYKTTKGRSKTDWESLCKDKGISDETVAQYTSRGGSFRTFKPTFPKQEVRLDDDGRLISET